MDLVTVVGSIAACCTTVSYVPQLKKCWETGTAGDLSLRTLLVLAIGLALWIGYGALKSDIVIMAANATSLALLLALLGCKLRGTNAPRPAAADSALRLSEERYRTVVENARDYAIFTTDLDGRIVDWYSGAASIFGWSAEEIRGRAADLLYVEEDRANGQPSLELTTAAARGVAPDVRWHLHRDGRRVFIEGKVFPIVDGSGQHGFLKIGQDMTDRREAERALRQSEERFGRFADASSDVLWVRRAEDLRFEYVSPAVASIYGVALESIAGTGLRPWLRRIHPDDRAAALHHIRAVRAGERRAQEFRVCRPDGTLRWVKDAGFPLLDETGHVLSVAGIGVDVTEERTASNRLQVVVNELQHRTRNLIAVVRALSDATASDARSIQDFTTRFGQRLSALSRVQGMLSRLNDGERVAFDTLLTAELSAHGMLDDSRRVTLEGPAGVELKSRNVQTFALVLHELATNAVKHGAFAQPPGRLAVRWWVDGEAEQARLHVVWQESAVPIAGSDIGFGYGRELIERALPYQLDAETGFVIADGGVRCSIVLSLSGE
ncbi:hypothetical protein BH11PSE3_BH11PSE3_15400 [soil metagenome]